MWLVACVVLCWGSRQRVSVVTTSSTSSSSSSVSFVRASLLLPACLHVPVGFEGVVVMIRRVVGRVAACTVVLPLGLAQQLLLGKVSRLGGTGRERDRGGSRKVV